MFFFRRWLLILCVLLLGSGSLMAASSKEERAYAAAVAAFRGGFYSQAETEFAQFVEKYKSSHHVPEAVLLQAQAQLQQDQFAEAISALSTPPADWTGLADQYRYWLGEALYKSGDYQRAATNFIGLATDYPESPLRLDSVVEAASAFKQLGAWLQIEHLLEQTNGVFAVKSAAEGGNELVSRGRLLLAEAQFKLGNETGAGATLQQLDPQTLPASLDWERAGLQCRVFLKQGDLDRALAVTTNLVNLARQQKDAAVRMADSVALRGTVLDRMEDWTNAASVWSQNLTNTAPAERQREAVLKLAENAVKQGQFTNAMARLGDFLLQFSNSPAADLALLTQGELGLKQYMIQQTDTSYLLGALQNFNQLLSTNSTPKELVGRAYLDRGWCNWFELNYPASLADFQAATERLSLSPELAVARFKLGDVLLLQTNYAGALTNYEAALNDFARLPSMKSLGGSALYQIIRCHLKLKNASGAKVAMKRLLQEYPESSLADDAMLLLGEGLANLASPVNPDDSSLTDAVEVLRSFATQFPGSPLNSQVKLELARTFEREQNWPAAIAGYENWLGEFPTNDLRPQVEYALGWAEYQSGNETNALARFTDFVSRHPTNELAPQAQWWVADHYFRLGGDYSEAEKNYEYIFQTTNAVWKKSPLFYPAQLMAGRAAMARQGYSDAKRYFNEMTADTNCPPDLATKARFAYGGVLMSSVSPDTNQPLANFELATNVFTELYRANPTNEYGPMACNELGDCNVQLGALEAATNAYGLVIQSPYAGVGLRCRAQVALGGVLKQMAETASPKERKTLQKQALANFLEVFQTNLGRGLNDHEAPEAFWVKEAGLQMLPLMTALKEGNLDNFFDRMEKLLPQMKEALEKKKMAMEAERN